MSRSFSVRILKNTGCFIWDSQKLFAYNFCIIPIIMIVQWLQQLTIILVLVLTFICSSFYKSEYFDSIFWSEILQTLLCKELFLFQCFTKGNFLLEHFEWSRVEPFQSNFIEYWPKLAVPCFIQNAQAKNFL